MRLFTRHGFIGVVSARYPGRSIDPARIVVRARVRRHLERLLARYPEELAGVEIIDCGGTDYAHRIVVGKSAWVRVTTALAADIDYDNFKSEVAQYRGKEGEPYEEALHEVWHTMYDLQDYLQPGGRRRRLP